MANLIEPQGNFSWEKAVSFFDNLRSVLFGIPRTEENQEESLLHIGWEQREESFYPALFGDSHGEQRLLTEEVFKTDFGRNDVHPFWLHHGVFTFPPTAKRSSWLYVTSGMSNAFDNEVDEWSGLGVEYILETPAAADWAIDKLQRLMAFNLLITIGHYRDQSDLTTGSIVRLGIPITEEDGCQLENFIALEPVSVTKEFQLVTGKVELLQMVPITNAEADFADLEGHEVLAQKLLAAHGNYTADAQRLSLI